MNVNDLIGLLSKNPANMHVDVAIGDRLVQIVGISTSGECQTGLKLELACECEVVEAKQDLNKKSKQEKA